MILRGVVIRLVTVKTLRRHGKATTVEITQPVSSPSAPAVPPGVVRLVGGATIPTEVLLRGMGLARVVGKLIPIPARALFLVGLGLLVLYVLLT